MPTGVRVDVSLEFPDQEALAAFEQGLALSGFSLEGYLQLQIAEGLLEQGLALDPSSAPFPGGDHG